MKTIFEKSYSALPLKHNNTNLAPHLQAQTKTYFQRSKNNSGIWCEGCICSYIWYCRAHVPWRTYKDEGTGKFLSFSWLCKYSNTCHLSFTMPLEDDEEVPLRSMPMISSSSPCNSTSQGPPAASPPIMEPWNGSPVQDPHDPSSPSSDSTLQGFGKGGWLGRVG